jgi:hypothetical protein
LWFLDYLYNEQYSILSALTSIPLDKRCQVIRLQP